MQGQSSDGAKPAFSRGYRVTKKTRSSSSDLRHQHQKLATITATSNTTLTQTHTRTDECLVVRMGPHARASPPRIQAKIKRHSLGPLHASTSAGFLETFLETLAVVDIYYA